MKDTADKFDDNFDFGFSIIDAQELYEVQEIQKTVNEFETTTAHWISEAEMWKHKAQTIHRVIQPLLNNLCSSPEKEYILWPDRVDKIKAFKMKLLSIIED
jgi:hypothetical protein